MHRERPRARATEGREAAGRARVVLDDEAVAAAVLEVVELEGAALIGGVLEVTRPEVDRRGARVVHRGFAQDRRVDVEARARPGRADADVARKVVIRPGVRRIESPGVRPVDVADINAVRVL